MKQPKMTSMAFACFASCPVVVIAVLFLIKILSLKNFIFGDDRQQLIWFHPGRIAYPIVDLVREEISIGRFRPLFYQDFNLVSLLSSDLTLHNLAERCFYVQGGMWMLTCVVFLALMAAILKEERKTASAWISCFIPLSLLALLCTPAVISYFLMLVFQEKLLCVLLPSFLLVYYTGYRKDNAIFLLVAWLLATTALYCKENTFVVFLTICGVWFLFGRNLLTRRHRTFLLCLLASLAVFFLLYYFIVYRHTVAAYNQDRLWGVAMSTHVMRILRTYPIYVPMILLGAFRLTRMLFARDRRHLFMDAVLFSALCLFLSFLALGLVDWWYWGPGTVFLFPVMFYWLIICRNILVRLAGFGVVVVCLLLNRENVANRIAEIDYAHRKDMAFIRHIDQNPACRRLRYCSFKGNSHIEECMYIYLRDFMEHLGTEGRWRENVLHETEVPETLDRDDIYVVRTGTVLPDDFTMKMERNLFCCVGECSFFRMFAYCPPSPPVLPVALFADSKQCLISGCSGFEENPGGRWFCGERSQIVFDIADLDAQRRTFLSVEGFPYFGDDFKENNVACSVNGMVTTNLMFGEDMDCLKFHVGSLSSSRRSGLGMSECKRDDKLRTGMSSKYAF